VSKHFSLLNSTSSPSSSCSALRLLFAPAGAPSGTVAFDLPGPHNRGARNPGRRDCRSPRSQTCRPEIGSGVTPICLMSNRCVMFWSRHFFAPPPILRLNPGLPRRKRGTSRCARKGSFSTVRRRVATRALSGSRDHRRFQHPALGSPGKPGTFVRALRI
jgi:hypothetical protein